MNAHRKENSTTPNPPYWDAAQIADPSTWWSFVMRLPDNIDPVVAYDILGYGKEDINNKTYTPRAFMLHGSIDGSNWDLLDDYDAGEGALAGGEKITWLFGQQTWAEASLCHEDDIRNHTGGRSIRSCPKDLPPAVLANVTEISVAAGARLAVTGGDAIELRDGITLTVDASTGAGTLANIIIPENGTLNLVNVPEYSGSLEMPISGENVTGLANVAGWNLSIDGVAQSSSKRKCRYENGKIVLYNPGTVVVFR
jgi:hypothetical protein